MANRLADLAAANPAAREWLEYGSRSPDHARRLCVAVVLNKMREGELSFLEGLDALAPLPIRCASTVPAQA